MSLSVWNAMGLLLGCNSGPHVPDEAGETVRALRYKRIAFESFTEFSHGDGTWLEEMYFPGEGVVATLASISSLDEESLESKDTPVLHAYHGDMGNKFVPYPNAEETEQPVEEIRVPAELAKKIFALAERRRELEAEEQGLGGMLRESGLLRMNVGPPSGGLSEGAQ
jgi:hypothetical protein